MIPGAAARAAAGQENAAVGYGNSQFPISGRLRHAFRPGSRKINIVVRMGFQLGE